ncbi:alpha/beta fold hydrolase [Halorhabdus salina]|uniref:alpha/beta fold hydrolase n=1 Tax=Halorhabdus salina TaxID=2750670 RepID=UPI002868399E|nr:alpha/beta fold hydrolase [Halorhabdus salina]
MAIVGVLLYFGTPFHGSPESIQAVQENDQVALQVVGGDYVLTPANATSATGLVFYPGARVHPDAYLSSVAPLVAEANVTVVVVKLPLNLAVLERGAATGVMQESAVDQWYVGGHSLGGAMACRYAKHNPDRVSGVVLFGSYCDQSIEETDLAVLSVAGEADTVLDWGTYAQTTGNLPANATVRTIPGVNHTQFGSYTGQPGDQPSGTTYAVAHQRLANVTVSWFQQAQSERTG